MFPKISRFIPSSLFELYRYATYKDMALISLGLLMAIIDGGCPVAAALVTGNLAADLMSFTSVDASSPQENVSSKLNEDGSDFELKMNCYAIIYLVVAITVFLAGWIQISCWQLVCERICKQVRLNYLRSILRQSLCWYDQNQSGSLSTYFNDDLERIHDGIGDKLGTFIRLITTFLSANLIGLALSWKLTLVILAFCPLFGFFTAKVSQYVTSWAKLQRECYAKAGTLASEALSAIRTVLSLNGQKVEIDKYKSKLDEGSKIAIKDFRFVAIFNSLSLLVLYCSYGLALYVAALLIHNKQVSVSSAFSVILVVVIGANSVGNLLPLFESLIVAVSSAKCINRIIDTVPEIDPYDDKGLKPSSFVANVRFKNVSFAYPARDKLRVLEDININILEGKTMAICGHTGCGKSTIINLLLRFYDPNDGAIYLDDYNLKELNVGWLRSTIGLVEQEPALFDSSIRENIALGARQGVEPSDDNIMNAAKLAMAHDFIMSFPEGYETRCGERGVQMSGGQKQRIAIARALLSNPRILLLDEATSALDSANEAQVQEALSKASVGRTTIVIAHRLCTIRNADVICVMDGGQIVETGKHPELMAKKGKYYDLVTNQVFHDKRYVQIAEKLEPKKLKPTTKAEVTSSKTQACSKPIAFDEQNVLGKPSPRLTDLWRLLRPGLRGLAAANLGFIASGLVKPVFGLFYSEIFDTLSRTGNELLSYAQLWTIMFVLLGIAYFIILSLGDLTTRRVIEKMFARIRTDCYVNILSQDMKWFDSKQNSSQILTTRLAADVPQMKWILYSRFVLVVCNITTIMASIFISLCFGWKLTLLVAASIPLIIFVGLLEYWLLTSGRDIQSKRIENVSRMATEAIQNVKTIQAINKQNQFCSIFKLELGIHFTQSIRYVKTLGIVYGITRGTIYLVYAAAFRFGAHLVAMGDMQPVDVFRVFYVMVFSAIIVGQWAGMNADTIRAKQAAGRLIDIMSAKSEIDNLSGSGLMPNVHGCLTFDKVTFSYSSRPDVMVLSNLSFKLESGRSLTIVGESGSGKSTIASLLLRFYDPDLGSIMIDGIDIRQFNISRLRSNIGIVSQEPCLFKASITDNILYGLDRSEYSHLDVIKVAKLANIHDFVMSLPEGYNTQVGERGHQISGGQKQRVAIARMLIRNPKIIILDEATSALDSESEAIVNEALKVACKGRTCIKIAHRLSTIRDSDHIAVIDNGQIVEFGSHKQLMSLGVKGRYFRLIQNQAK